MNIELYFDDCIKSLDKIPEKSVNLVLCDLPYGVTQNKWDHIIPPEQLWPKLERIITDNAAIILTATQPFASLLITSNLSMFKYDLIWSKTIASGQLNVKRQPLRTHEHILVFYKKQPTYNEQKTKGEPYSISRKANYANENYGAQKENSKVNDGYRHAKSVLTISNPRIKGGHPTQKPDELLTNLIKTYSNPGDMVLDCCMGSGSTGVAAIGEGRSFIGMENDSTYFDMALGNIKTKIGQTYVGTDADEFITIK